MKGKTGAFVFLTAILILSTASALSNTITVHMTVEGNTIMTLQLEKVTEDAQSVTVKFTETDMAVFQYYFAIAAVIEQTGFTITDIIPGYYVVTIAKRDLKQKGTAYVMDVPRSCVKAEIDTTVLTRYEGKDLLEVRVYAADKYLRTLVAFMGTDVAGVNLHEGYMTVLVSYEELLGLYLAGFTVDVVSDFSVGILELEPEYYTYPEVVTELSQIETDHPSIAEVISLGTSYEGRDIPGIKISDNVGTEESEPEVFICALHHAREAATVNVAMYIVNYLTDNYSTDPYIAGLVDNREIYIFPVINPDGKVYDDSGGSYGSGLMWRKNRQPCSGGIGTDLNRNYSYMWGGAGSSGSCTNILFRGYEPFDAPETAAVRDFFNAHPDINVLLTYHSHGNLVLWPWGCTYDPIADADDRQVHEIMGQQYASYTGYTPQQASDLYICTGTTDDWSYSETMNDAIPCFSFTIEMGNEFYPPPSALPAMCADNCDGTVYFIDCADNPYKVLGGTPYVTITNPQNGQTVSGTVGVTTDTSGVDTVEFYIDGVLTYTDTAAPYEYTWDTTQYTDGSHTVTAEGYASGVFKDDDQVTVTVNNVAPYVTITNPSEGQTVSGTVYITTDTAGVDTVKFYIKGKLKYTDTAPPFEYRWNTKSTKDGSCIITVEGYASDVFIDDDQITVTVQNKASIALLSLLVLFLFTGIYRKC
jgi:hypothetical protein